MDTHNRNQLIDETLAHMQAGQSASAHAKCTEVLKANDQDAEAWSLLGMIMIGVEPEASLTALERAVLLESEEPRWYIHFGIGLGRTDQQDKAEPILRRAANLSNHAQDAVLPWAQCLRALGRNDEAVSILNALIKVTPSSYAYRELSNVLSASGDYLGAVNARENVFVGRDIPHADAVEIINMHVMLGQYDKAQTYVDVVLPKTPDAPDVVLQAANLMRWRGELDAAHELLSGAYTANAGDGQILLALLDLNRDKDVRFIDDAKACVEANKADLNTRRGLAFVLARRADRANAYDEAWHFGTIANDLYDDGVVSEVSQYRRQLAAGLALYKSAETQNTSGDAQHLYVVGPPRSGGSLLQTILCAHPELTSVGERGALMSWLLPILDKSPNAQEALANWRDVAGQLPISDTAGMRKSYPGGDAQIFVDKMPHHAHVAGLLEKLHPNSQFVDVRRDPFDITMSIFLHDFSDKFGYSRKVGDIADYLVFQRDAVTAWQQAGVDILVHEHGAFLDDPKGKAKALFDRLGFDWQDEYLEPENRQSTVRTFSALQVRSKISKQYAGRGQNYMEFLGDTAEKLQSLWDR